jgi:hypothetical protein
MNSKGTTDSTSRSDPENTGAPDAEPSDTYSGWELHPVAVEVEAAAARTDWRASPERRRAVRTITALATLLALAAVVGFFVSRTVTDRDTAGLVVLGLVTGLGYFFAFISFVYLRAQRRAWRDRRLIGTARANLDRAEAALPEGSDDATDFGSLWTVTQKRLDYYHQIATSQAERSFLYGQIAAGLGLTLILGCAAAAALSRTTAASIAATLLGVAGGGLAGYIGSTFMRSQETASAQLRAYFLQPLEFSKMLAAERLLLQMDDPVSRTAATGSLIEALARAPQRGGDNP